MIYNFNYHPQHNTFNCYDVRIGDRAVLVGCEGLGDALVVALDVHEARMATLSTGRTMVIVLINEKWCYWRI